MKEKVRWGTVRRSSEHYIEEYIEEYSERETIRRELKHLGYDQAKRSFAKLTSEQEDY